MIMMIIIHLISFLRYLDTDELSLECCAAVWLLLHKSQFFICLEMTGLFAYCLFILEHHDGPLIINMYREINKETKL